MVALSDHLRMNMADESIIHNWIIRGASKSLTRQNGNELSLRKEKRIRLPTPICFHETYHQGIYVTTTELEYMR
jgi:hypothetical protein